MTTLPKKLYKYQPLSILSLENLKNNQIYFNAPIDFNDPFDCSINPSSPDEDEEDLVKCMDLIKSKGPLEFKDLTLDAFKNYPQIINDILQKKLAEYSKDGKTSFGLDMDALTGVYFGSEMDFAHIEIIMLVLQGQTNKVRFYKGARSKKEFKVSFDEVHYSTYLESKV